MAIGRLITLAPDDEWGPLPPHAERRGAALWRALERLLLVIGLVSLAAARVTPASYVDVVASARSLASEAVTAVVVAANGQSVDGDALIAALRREIAAYKVPKRVHVVAELPRNAMGKVQKNVLRERFG